MEKRSSTDFEKLKKENILKEKGMLVKLPDLGLYPKDFGELSFYYYLSEQRTNLLMKLLKKDRLSSNGAIFIGPHGVGKSTTAYFLASYAFINNYFLIYIPNVATWTELYSTGQKEASAKYFVNNFLKLNQDLLEKYPKFKEFFNKYKYLIDDSRYGMFQAELQIYLQDQKETEVYYVLDEHQEFYKDGLIQGEKMTFSKVDYFDPYTKWTGLASGPNTTTIYCGSSNSKFQYLLPKGEENKRFYFTPPKDDELVKMYSLLLVFIILFLKVKYKDNPDELKKYEKRFKKAFEEDLDETIKYTGKIPREIFYLVDCNFNYQEYFQNRRKIYDENLNSWVKKLDEREETEFYENLENLFSLRFTGTVPSFHSSFYDKGLMYQESYSSTPKFINFPARKALLKYFIEKGKIIPIDSIISNTEKGLLLQRQSLLNEMKGKRFFPSYFTGKLSNPVDINYRVTDYINFQVNSFKKISQVPSETTLFIPDENSQELPYMDYFIYNPDENQIIFKQITISPVTSHLKKSLNFNPKKGHQDFSKYNDVAEVIHFLFLKSYKLDGNYFKKVQDHTGDYSLCECLIEYIMNIKPIISIKNDKFIIQNDQGNEMNIIILYGSGLGFEFNCIKKKEKMKEIRSFLDLSLKNILYYCKEEMIKNGILFEK